MLSERSDDYDGSQMQRDTISPGPPSITQPKRIVELELSSTESQDQIEAPLQPQASPADVVEQSKRELVAVLRQLKGSLPRGLTYLVPEPQSDTDISWLYCSDFSELLEKLKVPRFGGHFVHHVWEKQFAAGCSDKASVALGLSLLFEAQAEPTERADDVQQAAWCILFHAPRMAPTPSDEDERVLPQAELDQLLATRASAINHSLKQLREQKSPHAWSPQSALRALGYRVGHGCRPQATRQVVLRDALVIPLEFIPVERRAAWGAPGTRRRLNTIRRMLCLFRNLASGKDTDMQKAISDWTADLEWLDREYDNGQPYRG